MSFVINFITGTTAEGTYPGTGMLWNHVHFSGIWLKQDTLWQLTIKTY